MDATARRPTLEKTISDAEKVRIFNQWHADIAAAYLICVEPPRVAGPDPDARPSIDDLSCFIESVKQRSGPLVSSRAEKLVGDALRKVLLYYRDRCEAYVLGPVDHDIFTSISQAYALLCFEPHAKIYNAFKPKRCPVMEESETVA